jgi:hypothetical protein
MAERRFVLMWKPKLIIDPQPRTMDLIFDPEARHRLATIADLTVFDTGPMPVDMLEAALPEANILIGQTDLPRARLEKATKLQAIFNVEGNYLPNIDYEFCFSRNIRVLNASPRHLPLPSLKCPWHSVWIWRGASAKTIATFVHERRIMASRATEAPFFSRVVGLASLALATSHTLFVRWFGRSIVQ